MRIAFAPNISTYPSSVWGESRSDILSRFDVLLIDERTLRSMDPAERTAIREAVRRGGLGVLMDPGMMAAQAGRLPTADAAFFQPLRLQSLPADAATQIELQWRNGPSEAASPLPITPLRIDIEVAADVLVRDSLLNPVTIAIERGQGRLGISLVEATYQWILQQEPEAYSSYWSLILSHLARAGKI